MTPSKEQKAIIKHKKGHAFVHAGAGCGKTSVLLASIRAAIQRGIPPSSIIVLTYNRATVTDFNQHTLIKALSSDMNETFLSKLDRISNQVVENLL